MSTSLNDVPLILHLDDKKLPAIKNWKVGETYHLQLKVKQVSMREGSLYGEDDKNKITADFEVLNVKEIKQNKKYYSKEVIKKAANY